MKVEFLTLQFIVAVFSLQFSLQFFRSSYFGQLAVQDSLRCDNFRVLDSSIYCAVNSLDVPGCRV